MVFSEGCLNFVDMEQEDWIFSGDVKADIQYRVYRDMRSACRKNWAKFTPKVGTLLYTFYTGVLKWLDSTTTKSA